MRAVQRAHPRRRAAREVQRPLAAHPARRLPQPVRGVQRRADRLTTPKLTVPNDIEFSAAVSLVAHGGGAADDLKPEVRGHEPRPRAAGVELRWSSWRRRPVHAAAPGLLADVDARPAVMPRTGDRGADDLKPGRRGRPPTLPRCPGCALTVLGCCDQHKPLLQAGSRAGASARGHTTPPGGSRPRTRPRWSTARTRTPCSPRARSQRRPASTANAAHDEAMTIVSNRSQRDVRIAVTDL